LATSVALLVAPSSSSARARRVLRFPIQPTLPRCRGEVVNDNVHRAATDLSPLRSSVHLTNLTECAHSFVRLSK
jgi:hypothetical protein